MHQAMAKALVKAQRRAAAPQSTGRRQEKRPCTDIVPRTAPQSAVPMDSEPTGAVGARSMIAALQKAASRSARGGSRKVPASAKAPATAGIPPSIKPIPLCQIIWWCYELVYGRVSSASSLDNGGMACSISSSSDNNRHRLNQHKRHRICATSRGAKHKRTRC